MTNPSLMVVVQRYGDIAGGGAEPHARAVVQRLRPYFNVEVATTTARDYWTWANEFTPGLTALDREAVHRDAVDRGEPGRELVRPGPVVARRRRRHLDVEVRP